MTGWLALGVLGIISLLLAWIFSNFDYPGAAMACLIVGILALCAGGWGTIADRNQACRDKDGTPVSTGKYHSICVDSEGRILP